jgi:hypothetical protein
MTIVEGDLNEDAQACRIFIPERDKAMTVHTRTRQQPRVGNRVSYSQRTGGVHYALEHSRYILFWYIQCHI